MNENNMGDLSIIIVSWNTRNLLMECLQSLYQYTKGITFEVFVVDNNSSDGSAEMVRKLFPEVMLIQNKENAGFSKANNQAIRVSKGRYIALLNPDTLLIEDVFAPLIRYADQNEKIGALGPKILCRDGKTIQYACARRLPNLYFDFCRLSGLSSRFKETRIFGGEYLSYWHHKSSRRVEGLSGSCMVVRSAAIDDVGLMDEEQFMYGDEIDWCKRLLKAGWQVCYYAYVAIIHYGGESAKQVQVLTKLEAEKARCNYYKKHHGKIHQAMFRMLLCFFSITKLIWKTILKKENSVDDSKTHKAICLWLLNGK